MGRNPVLVYLPTGEVVSSIVSLQGSLGNLGWEMSIGGDAERLTLNPPPTNSTKNSSPCQKTSSS
ncbi:unnamed protein product [Brassica oleracea var. botrytis]|uniref:Uncharacterized protein n=3 Tax=Brassica TaxID=3705 RepID=A0A8X7WQW7_BRACI|nr:hypothetical protein Bca52824_005519 [Brassica carinata]CAF1696965.1 unnamed protein product [Brassica napus]VDC85833.1 unnamed protein product [Brassica oleracea]